MPTRLVVLLQSRKSAAAGSPASATAPTASGPPKRALVRRRAGRELIIVRRSFIVPQEGIPKRADFTRDLMNCQHGELSTCAVSIGSQRAPSTTIARKSFTLVWVAPVLKRLSTPAKNSVELLSARKAAGS